MSENIKNIIAVIDYIENKLYEELDLGTVAQEVHYSKYHLHRMFTDTVGLSIHEYVQCRRLTEAAKLLVFSDMPIIDIALFAGYKSRQSFSYIFKAMYKKTPNQYREQEEFYPLQLRYNLKDNPASFEVSSWHKRIVFATNEDIPEWIKLVCLVIDGFPHLNQKQYDKQLRQYIKNRRALILKDDDTAIGIMAFNEKTGSINFLGVHPQYQNKGIASAFCEKALYELVETMQITITTFREGDKADTGYREIFKHLGFIEAELLVEFGYPTQRFILKKKMEDE